MVRTELEQQVEKAAVTGCMICLDISAWGGFLQLVLLTLGLHLVCPCLLS